MDTITLLFAIVALIYGLLLFLYPRNATYLLILLCIFQFGWFTRYFGTTDYLGRIIYFFAMLLGARIITDFLLRRIKIEGQNNIARSILVFISGLALLILLSNTYNQESITLGLYELRYYLLLAVLFFGIYYYSSFNYSLEGFIKSLVAIGLLQIPFAVVQFALAGGGDYRTLDSVTGTFSSYEPLVFLTVLNISLLLNHKLETNKNLFTINSYYLIFLLIIPLLLSKSRTASGLVLFMIVLIFISASLRRKTSISPVKAVVLMSIITFFTGILFYNFFWKPSYDIKTQLSPNYAISYYMREAQDVGLYTSPMGRARAVYEASKLVSEDLLTIFIGLGGGSVSEAAFLGDKGRYYFEHGPLTGVGRTQISKVIAENGIIGIFLFLYLFYVAWRNIQEIKIYKESFRFNYIIILSTVLLLSIYMAGLQSPIAALSVASFFALTEANMKKQQQQKAL